MYIWETITHIVVSHFNPFWRKHYLFEFHSLSPFYSLHLFGFLSTFLYYFANFSIQLQFLHLFLVVVFWIRCCFFSYSSCCANIICMLNFFNFHNRIYILSIKIHIPHQSILELYWTETFYALAKSKNNNKFFFNIS